MLKAVSEDELPLYLIWAQLFRTPFFCGQDRVFSSFITMFMHSVECAGAVVAAQSIRNRASVGAGFGARQGGARPGCAVQQVMHVRRGDTLQVRWKVRG